MNNRIPDSRLSSLFSLPYRQRTLLHRLLMIGLKTQDIDYAQAPPSNLVFLLDVSGSMDSYDKLPLLHQLLLAGHPDIQVAVRSQDNTVIAALYKMLLRQRIRRLYPLAPKEEPFGVTTQIGRCPWNENADLLMIGLKTQDIDYAQAPSISAENPPPSSVENSDFSAISSCSADRAFSVIDGFSCGETARPPPCNLFHP